MDAEWMENSGPCVKCGASYPNIHGPHFTSDSHGERLKFWCGVCLFTWYVPTKDAKAK